MSSLADIKNMIVQWFWKLGFGIGKQLGSVGQVLFGDAVRSGFELQAIESIDLGSMLATIKTDLEADLADNVTNVDAGISGLSDADLAEMFQGMFAEEMSEAGNMDASEAVFGGWTSVLGTAVVDPLNQSVTFTPGTGTHRQYTSGSVSFTIDANDGSLVVPFVKP